jgi:uncharacterized protein DUF4192
MSRAEPQVVSAVSLRDVVALVPFECGFHPQRSVVLLSMRGPRLRIGQVTRFDLPGSEDLPELLADIVAFVARDRGRASIVAVYDDQAWDPEQPPHLELVLQLLDELRRTGIPARDAVYVTPERYWSYLCREGDCCPAEGGLVSDAMSSPVAAAFVLAGLAPLAAREDLVARVQPSRPQLVAAVADSTWRWLAAYAADRDAAESGAGESGGLRDGSSAQECVRQWTAGAAAVLDRLVSAYQVGQGAVTVEQAGQLIAALQSVPVRDELLLRHCRVGLPAPADGSAGSLEAALRHRLAPAASVDPESEEAMERILVDLCTRVEGPLAAAPLSLLGWHSWARGEGALARIAVDRAATEDPTYRLAVLLSTVLDHGIAPDWVGAARDADEEAS